MPMYLTVPSLPAVLAALLITVTAPPASALPDEASGRAAARCTITGTPGPDRLVGTGGADVICGLGGDDLILGRAGADRILAGAGADLVSGGPARDTIIGGSGDDRLSGDGAQDNLLGGPGRDALHGGDQADRLSGDAGDDDLLGGPGRDTVIGGDGRDRLHGGSGNDRLDGGARTDTLAGGPGHNTCAVDDGETATRCRSGRDASPTTPHLPATPGHVGLDPADPTLPDGPVEPRYDLDPPALHEFQVSVTTIDVSQSDQTFTVRAHITDDTEIRDVYVSTGLSGSGYADEYARGRRVAGSVRDGWWVFVVTVPQYSLPGPYRFTVDLSDRMDRWTKVTDAGDATVQVTTADFDLEPPVLQRLLSPAPTEVLDVREHDGRLRVSARLTDNLSGVNDAHVCAEPVSTYIGFLPCAELALVSGTTLDGTWSGDIVIERGAVGEQWKLSLVVRDRAIPWEPGQYYSHLDDYGPPTHLFSPRGSGVFSVIGSDPPASTRDPEVTSVVLSPSTVDTLAGPAIVLATVEINDPDVIVTQARLALHQTGPEGYTGVSYEGFLSRDTDGRWRGQVVLPQGAPPGRYQAMAVPYDTRMGYIHYVDAFVTVVDSTAAPGTDVAQQGD
jgi:hypothetical protein